MAVITVVITVAITVIITVIFQCLTLITSSLNRKEERIWIFGRCAGVNYYSRLRQWYLVALADSIVKTYNLSL